MPETSREQALVAVERARRLIAATVAQPFRITVSAGICDTNATAQAAELFSFADAALYWSKAHGRNRGWIYDPDVITEWLPPNGSSGRELAGAARPTGAGTRDRRQGPATRQHSERVATLAVKLARAAGWPAERAAQLSEAALVHDVGKVGVPDELLQQARAAHRFRAGTPEGARRALREDRRRRAHPRAGVVDPHPSRATRRRRLPARSERARDPRGCGAAGGRGRVGRDDERAAIQRGEEGRPRPSPSAPGWSEAVHEAAVGALLKLHARGELDPTIQGSRRSVGLHPGSAEPPADAADRLRTASNAHYPRGRLRRGSGQPDRGDTPSASSRRWSRCPRRPATSAAPRRRSQCARRCCRRRRRHERRAVLDARRRSRPDRADRRRGRGRLLLLGHVDTVIGHDDHRAAAA